MEIDDLPKPIKRYEKPFQGRWFIKPVSFLSDEKAWHRIVVDVYEYTQYTIGCGVFKHRKIKYSRVMKNDYSGYCECKFCRKEKRASRQDKIVKVKIYANE